MFALFSEYAERLLARFGTRAAAYVNSQHANSVNVVKESGPMKEELALISQRAGKEIVREEIAITGRQRLSLLFGGEIPVGERQMLAGSEQFYLFKTGSHFALDYHHGYEGKTYCPHCSFPTLPLKGGF